MVGKGIGNAVRKQVSDLLPFSIFRKITTEVIMRICVVEGCGNRHHSRGFCNGNYEFNNLHWATPAENMQNTRSNVVNWFTVRSIRRLYKLKKYTQGQLAKIYKLNRRTISDITLGKTWKETTV